MMGTSEEDRHEPPLGWIVVIKLDTKGAYIYSLRFGEVLEEKISSVVRCDLDGVFSRNLLTLEVRLEEGQGSKQYCAWQSSPGQEGLENRWVISNSSASRNQETLSQQQQKCVSK